MRFLRGLGGYGIVELSQELLGDQTLPASTVFLENLQQVTVHIAQEITNPIACQDIEPEKPSRFPSGSKRKYKGRVPRGEKAVETRRSSSHQKLLHVAANRNHAAVEQPQRSHFHVMSPLIESP